MELRAWCGRRAAGSNQPEAYAHRFTEPTGILNVAEAVAGVCLFGFRQSLELQSWRDHEGLAAGAGLGKTREVRGEPLGLFEVEGVPRVLVGAALRRRDLRSHPVHRLRRIEPALRATRQ